MSGFKTRNEETKAKMGRLKPNRRKAKTRNGKAKTRNWRNSN